MKIKRIRKMKKSNQKESRKARDINFNVPYSISRHCILSGTELRVKWLKIKLIDFLQKFQIFKNFNFKKI